MRTLTLKLPSILVIAPLLLSTALAQDEYSIKYKVSDSKSGESVLTLRKKGEAFCVEGIPPKAVGSTLALYTKKYTAVRTLQPGGVQTIELHKPGRSAVLNPPLLPFEAGPLSVTASTVKSGRVRNVDAVTEDDENGYDKADFKLDSEGRVVEVTQNWEGKPYQTQKYTGYRRIAPGLDVPAKIEKEDVEKGRERKTTYELVSAKASCSEQLVSTALLKTGSVVSVQGERGSSSFYFDAKKGDVQDQADKASSSERAAAPSSESKRETSPVVVLALVVAILLAVIYLGSYGLRTLKLRRQP